MRQSCDLVHKAGERRRLAAEAAGTRHMRRGEKVPRAAKPTLGQLAQRQKEYQAGEEAKLEHFRRLLQPSGDAAPAPLPPQPLSQAPLPFSRGAGGGGTEASTSRSMARLDAFGELRNFKGQLK